MKLIRWVFLVMFVVVTTVLQAQEHGPVIGGSYGTFYKKYDVWTIDSKGYKPHFHVGYSYRQHFKHQLALDVTALYGTQGTDYQRLLSDDGKIFEVEGDYDVKGQYLSLGGVLNYECFKNFRVGVGADVAWYRSKIVSQDYSVKTNSVDVPLTARVSYSLKYVEFQLTYKQGLFSVVDNPHLGKMKARDFQLSVFVPLFK